MGKRINNHYINDINEKFTIGVTRKRRLYYYYYNADVNKWVIVSFSLYSTSKVSDFRASITEGMSETSYTKKGAYVLLMKFINKYKYRLPSKAVHNIEVIKNLKV